MSNIITTTGRTASTIAAEIRAYNAQFLYCAFEIGKRLVEAKALVGHGGWMEFLEVEIGYKQSFANNMMRLYNEYNVNGQLPNSQTYVNLSPSQALALIAVPADEREDFIQETDAGSKSVRELKAAIKERDEARQAQEKAEAETRDLQKALASAQDDVAAAKAAESASQKEIDKLNAALNKASAEVDKAKKDLQAAKANPTVPASMRKQLEAAAAEKAAKETEKKLRAEIDAAKEQARQATQARETAERTAREAEQRLADSQKSAVFADPNTAALKLLFDQLQSDFNKANGYLMKLSAASPETGAKFKGAFLTLVDEMRKRLA